MVRPERLELPALWFEGPGDIRVKLIPGEFRTGHVHVGRHIPPDAEQVPGLIAALGEFSKFHGRTLASLMLMHHRFAWIHPFFDGNGRTSRLLTEAMLLRSPAGGAGLWCLSRGLAKNAKAYRARLADADSPVRGAYDGRGELSREAAEEFVRFMLDTAIDQARFMGERLAFDDIAARIQLLCLERAQVLGRAARAARLVTQVVLRGSVERGSVGELVGLSERRGRDITRECLADGLITSPSEKGLLLPHFPMWVMAYLFPNLFPLDNPRAAMREYLSAEVRPELAGRMLRDRLGHGGANSA